MKKLLKTLALSAVIAYVAYMFISQQHMLNIYRNEEAKYEELIENEKKTQEELVAMKDNTNSPEFIEQIAREKLGMYLPNERVYIDIGK